MYVYWEFPCNFSLLNPYYLADIDQWLFSSVKIQCLGVQLLLCSALEPVSGTLQNFFPLPQPHDCSFREAQHYLVGQGVYVINVVYILFHFSSMKMNTWFLVKLFVSFFWFILFNYIPSILLFSIEYFMNSSSYFYEAGFSSLIFQLGKWILTMMRSLAWGSQVKNGRVVIGTQVCQLLVQHTLQLHHGTPYTLC